MFKNISLFAVIISLVLISCDVELTKVNVSSIILNNTSINLNVGETASLTAEVKPLDAYDKNIIWASNNENVASVDNNGLIKAISKGTAKISATSKSSPSISASCIVNVTKVLNSLNLIDNLTLTLGENVTLNTNVSPKDANDTSVTWSSSDQNIATVSINGEITTITQGTINITATSKSNSALSEVCVLKISKPLTALGLSNTLSLEELETYPLVTNVTPKDANDTSVTWSSSDINIASVKSDGLVTALKVGNVKIRATANVNPAKYEEVDLTVNNISVKSISLPTSFTIKKGKPETLSVIFTPQNAFNKTIIWSSSDVSKATVKDGVIIGKSEGTAIITATSNNNKIATCTVNVILVAELLTFNFEKTYNSEMVTNNLDLIRYDGTNFGGTFKYIANNKLIPTFTTSSGAIVSVNGETQTSGTSVQDFTSPVYYLVSSQDGTVNQTFRIYINFENDSLDINADSLVCKPNFKNQLTTAILADSMNGFKVKKIGKYAFTNSGSINYTLKNLSLPNSLEIIGESAFEICVSLDQNLILPNSLKIIDNRAFSASTIKGDLNLPNSLISIGIRAFFNCFELNGKLNIGDNLKEIGYLAFTDAKISGSLILPNSLTFIGDDAFKGCTYLNGELKLSNQLTEISKNAFEKCNFTGNLILPESITKINDYSFSENKFSGNLILPEKLTYIGINAFYGCKNFIGSLVIPDNVTFIGNNSFNLCSGFNGTLTLGTGLTSIEESTFENTSFTGSLKYIFLNK